jgi:predicted cupin superfamily sugar epimerase
MMLNLFEGGKGQITKMGSNIFAGEQVQYLVPKNTWQGAKLAKGGRFALLGTTVSPGFEFEDFIQAKTYKNEILNKYPDFASLINELIKI